MGKGLLKGFRVPGSKHRRFYRRDVEAFAASHGIATEAHTINITVMHEPGSVAIDGLRLRAEESVNLGYLSECPVITVRPASNPPYYVIVLTVKSCDKAFWIGFWRGKDWCFNNKELTVGNYT